MLYFEDKYSGIETIQNYFEQSKNNENRKKERITNQVRSNHLDYHKTPE